MITLPYYVESALKNVRLESGGTSLPDAIASVHSSIKDTREKDMKWRIEKETERKNTLGTSGYLRTEELTHTYQCLPVDSDFWSHYVSRESLKVITTSLQETEKTNRETMKLLDNLEVRIEDTQGALQNSFDKIETMIKQFNVHLANDEKDIPDLISQFVENEEFNTRMNTITNDLQPVSNRLNNALMFGQSIKDRVQSINKREDRNKEYFQQGIIEGYMVDALSSNEVKDQFIEEEIDLFQANEDLAETQNITTYMVILFLVAQGILLIVCGIYCWIKITAFKKGVKTLYTGAKMVPVVGHIIRKWDHESK